eukprot:gene13321-biopygen11239
MVLEVEVLGVPMSGEISESAVGKHTGNITSGTLDLGFSVRSNSCRRKQDEAARAFLIFWTCEGHTEGERMIPWGRLTYHCLSMEHLVPRPRTLHDSHLNHPQGGETAKSWRTTAPSTVQHCRCFPGSPESDSARTPCAVPRLLSKARHGGAELEVEPQTAMASVCRSEWIPCDLDKPDSQLGRGSKETGDGGRAQRRSSACNGIATTARAHR